MEAVAIKKDEEGASKPNGTGLQHLMSHMRKAWMSCKETATDRTFFLPFIIICALFTIQAFSGYN